MCKDASLWCLNEKRHIGESGSWKPENMPLSQLTTRSVAGEIDYQSKDGKVKENFLFDFLSSSDEAEKQAAARTLSGRKHTLLHCPYHQYLAHKPNQGEERLQANGSTEDLYRLQSGVGVQQIRRQQRIHVRGLP